MTVIRDLQVGPLKKFTLTMGFREQDFSSSPFSIPTSEPATSQVSFTVQESDLPTITPSIPIGNAFGVHLTGKNSKLFVGNANLTYTIYKNGVSQVTSNTTIVNTQNSWGITHWRWINVVAGDVIEVKMWTTTPTATDMTIDYSNLVSYVSQPDLGRVKLLKDLKISAGTNPTPVTPSPPGAGGVTTAWNLANSGAAYFYPTTATSAILTVGGALNFNVFSPIQFSGVNVLYKAGLGDGAGLTSQVYSHTSLRQYQRQVFINAFEYREIR